MSTLLEPPAAAPAEPVPTGGRAGGLLRAELHRFRSRRFIQVLVGLLLVGWLVATVIGLTQFGEPTDADRAAARAEIEQLVADQERFRQECLADPDLPEELSPEEACGPEVTADAYAVEDFLGTAPFDAGATGAAGAVAFGAAAAVLAFLIGATWIGAEWSSRSIVALLFWVPRRLRVVGTKLAVLALGTAALGVLAQAAWLAMAGVLDTAVGVDTALPQGYWAELLATGGRSVLLAVLAGFAGFGLANLVRNTGAALGIGFVYFAVVETAIGAFRPLWQPWLLTNNAAGLVAPDGLTLYIWERPNQMEPTQYVVTNLQGGLVLAAVVAVVVGLGVALFATRDLH